MEEIPQNTANAASGSNINESNQKRIIIILSSAIAFLVLAIVAIFLVIYIKSDKINVEDGENAENNSSLPLTIEQCSKDTQLITECVLLFKIGNAKDECVKLQGQIKDNCFALLALTSRDTAYCDLISDNNRKEGCKLGPDLRDVGG